MTAEGEAKTIMDGGSVVEHESVNLEGLCRKAMPVSLSSGSSSSSSSSGSSSDSDSGDSDSGDSDSGDSDSGDSDSGDGSSSDPDCERDLTFKESSHTSRTACISCASGVLLSRYPLFKIPEDCDEFELTISSSMRTGLGTNSAEFLDGDLELKHMQPLAQEILPSLTMMRIAGAMQVQRIWRGRQCARQFTAMRNAALKLQCYHRVRRAKQMVRDLRQQKAALRLQRHFRKCLTAAQDMNRSLRHEKAALCLQDWFRKRVNARHVRETADAWSRKLQSRQIFDASSLESSPPELDSLAPNFLSQRINSDCDGDECFIQDDWDDDEFFPEQILSPPVTRRSRISTGLVSSDMNTGTHQGGSYWPAWLPIGMCGCWGSKGTVIGTGQISDSDSAADYDRRSLTRSDASCSLGIQSI